MLVLAHALGEPQSDLLVGALHRVRAVDHIPTDVDAVVPTKRPRLRRQRVGGADHLAPRLHHLLPLPYHRHHGPGRYVLDQAREERLGRQVSVVLLRERLLDVDHLQGAEVVPLRLEALDDLAHEASLDAVRLHHDERALHRGGCAGEREQCNGGCVVSEG